MAVLVLLFGVCSSSLSHLASLPIAGVPDEAAEPWTGIEILCGLLMHGLTLNKVLETFYFLTFLLTMENRTTQKNVRKKIKDPIIPQSETFSVGLFWVFLLEELCLCIYIFIEIILYFI